MTLVRAHYKGKDLIMRRKAVIMDLRLELILRQLYRDIQCAVEMEHERGIVFDAFPELEWLPADGGLM